MELTGTPQNGGVVLIKAAAAYRLALLVSCVVVLSSPSHGREQPGTSSSLVTRDEREAFLLHARFVTDAPPRR